MSDQDTLTRPRGRTSSPVLRDPPQPEHQATQATRSTQSTQSTQSAHPAGGPGDREEPRRPWYRRLGAALGGLGRCLGALARRLGRMFRTHDRKMHHDPDYRDSVHRNVAAGAHVADRLPRVGPWVAAAVRAGEAIHDGYYRLASPEPAPG